MKQLLCQENDGVRHCKFWATAKDNEDGTWRIHMYADYVPSEDAVVAEPFTAMIEMYDRWKKYILDRRAAIDILNKEAKDPK